MTADQLNTHVRDNLNALKTPPSGSYYTSGNYNTTSTSLTNVDGTNLSHLITSAGGAIFIGCTMSVTVAGSDYTAYVEFDLNVDGDNEGKAYRHVRKAGDSNDRTIVTILWRKGALSAGEHTFKLRWKIGGTASQADINGIQFWVEEFG